MVLVSQTELVQSAISGKVVSFPTDTVPALAVIPTQAALLYQVKQRPTSKPLILMAATWQDLTPYLQGTSAELANWQQVATTYFPGAVTLVLPASASVPQEMNPTKSGTIGIRIPDSAVAGKILQQTGAMATTSANLSGSETLVTTDAIAKVFPQVQILHDDFPHTSQGSGLPSTVVQWDQKNWLVLRQGSVKFQT